MISRVVLFGRIRYGAQKTGVVKRLKGMHPFDWRLHMSLLGH